LKLPFARSETIACFEIAAASWGTKVGDSFLWIVTARAAFTAAQCRWRCVAANGILGTSNRPALKLSVAGSKAIARLRIT